MDTHIALWAIANSTRLPDKVTALLESPANKIYYSVASVWEVAIKHKIKPDQMPMPEEAFVELCEATGFLQLPILAEHIYAVKDLERLESAPRHNDPFDRILISQAKVEGMNFVTHDALLQYYKEDCVLFV